MKVFRFSASGDGPSFPLDMLRHSRCFPANERASVLLRSALEPRPGILTIDLHGMQPPDMVTWKRCGWTIYAVEEVDV